MRLKTFIGIRLGIIVTLGMLACEVPTNLEIKGGNPLTFIMSGSARFDGIRIVGPKVREAEGEDQYVVWQIKGLPGGLKGVRSIGPIMYGKVPPGYKQVYPENGEAPPIIEGERYFVRVITTSAKGAEKYFTMRDGKIIVEEP